MQNKTTTLKLLIGNSHAKKLMRKHRHKANVSPTPLGVPAPQAYRNEDF